MANRVRLLTGVAGIMCLLLILSGCGRKEAKTNPYEKLSKADMKYKNIQIVNFTITPRGVQETDNPADALADAQSNCAAELMKSNLFENVKYVSKAEPADSTLIVQGELTRLMIVGVAYRTFVGGRGRRSEMAVYVKLMDAATGTVVGERDIREVTDPRAGRYTRGAVDKLLPLVVGNLIAEYIIDTSRK
jgi:hypothetical protein